MMDTAAAGSAKSHAFEPWHPTARIFLGRSLKCASPQKICVSRDKIPISPPSVRLPTLIFVSAALSPPLSGAPAATSSANVDWPAYLGDKARTLYSPLQQINRRNVAELKVAWTYDTGDKGEYQANNLVIDGVLYTAS